MNIQLSPNEARVLGVLLEKSITTPEQYPLSLNALTTGCNQKTNREPVTTLSENSVQDVCVLLKRKNLLMIEDNNGRVLKYKHRFCNTEFGQLKLTEQQLAVVIMLLLRGNQTAGELRTRYQRLAQFNDTAQVESVLQQLIEHQFGPFVVELPKELGKRDTRWQHLFYNETDRELLGSHSVPEQVTVNKVQDNTDLQQQIDELKQQVLQLQQQVQQLQQKQ